MSLILLLSGNEASADLGAVDLDLNTIDVFADLTVGETAFPEVTMTTTVRVDADLTARPRISTQPAPVRHYIWVYDLQGVKVDAIA